MLKSYRECVKVSSTIRTNKVFSYLTELPVLGKIFKKKDSSPASDMKNRVITEGLYFVREMAKIYTYVLLFIHLPMLLFSKYMATGTAGFGLEDSYVYFTLIMTCLAGSIIHSRFFDVNEDSYSMLKVIGVQPKIYFRVKIISRMVAEIIGFWSIFTILGMGPGKAMFMVLTIVASRMFGECFNILIFKMSKKRFSDMKSGTVAVMLAALFLAYFIPYVRGYVPAAYEMVFNPVVVFVILAVGAIMAYYVWNNDAFNKIVARIYIRKELEIIDEEEDICDSISYENKGEGESKKKQYSGYKFMTNLFFERNKMLFNAGNIFKCIIIGVAFLIAVIAANLGYVDVVKKVVSYSMPIMVFIMYCLCDVSRICKAMFYQHDRFILRNNISDTERVEDFLYRLVRLLRINAVPTGMLVLVYVIIGVLMLNGDSMNMMIQLFVAIVALMVLFTVFGLAIYYLLQPYNKDAQYVGYAYTIVSMIMYFAGYGCVHIKISGMSFMMGVVVTTGIVVAIAVTLVMKVAGKTFKIRK